LSAASEILKEKGFRDLTIEEVAARAHVGKATIYRNWETRGILALDAFMVDYLLLQPPQRGATLEEDLFSALAGWVAVVDGTPTGRALVGLLAEAQFDLELGKQFRDRVVAPARAAQRDMIERAVARGEIPPDTDLEILMDLLFGPAYLRLLEGHQPLSSAFVRRIARAVALAAREGVAVRDL